MEEAIIKALADVGFPAIVCGYVLIRVNQTLERLTEAIVRIDERLEVISKQTDCRSGNNHPPRAPRRQ